MRKKLSYLLFLLLSVTSTDYTWAQTFKPDFNDFLIAHSFLKKTSGVLYFQSDFKTSSQKMCDDLRSEPWRLTMIDQEGEPVTRLKGTSEPPSYADARKMTISQFYQASLQAAQVLKQQCLKVNLAPVVDTQQGTRNYSDNPQLTHQYGQAFSQAMHEAGIAATWKHFPGLKQVHSVYDTPYSHWYKNINGEGVVEQSDSQTITQNMQAFSSNQYDMVMFSLAIYPAISDKPIIFNQQMIEQARKLQPNSLLIPDDLSELNLKVEDVLWLFKHFDLLMFTSPQESQQVNAVLNKAYEQGLITETEVKDKLAKQNQWRSHNGFAPLL
jgi:hypothetical protein